LLAAVARAASRDKPGGHCCPRKSKPADRPDFIALIGEIAERSYRRGTPEITKGECSVPDEFSIEGRKENSDT
jgi:hypothetical protein